MNILKRFIDNSIVYYDRGKFDDYCVYLKEKDLSAKAPRDIEYFQYFIDLAKIYGDSKIYNDFCLIYDKTTDVVNNAILNLITEISVSYGENSLWVDKWFTVIYLGMVAEERKANAILKKKIKRLGFHQIMMENLSAYEAANFSRGKRAVILLQECQKRGF
ncbi:DUF7004 family protein [Campylobacter devanensis]|uniref:DUF7004 family protein n=1 Tax=Campylobacter devanensis TaxID=3161138 RepID=UPI000A3417B3|nr:hypothetical protein [Campylobacter sp. P0135]